MLALLLVLAASPLKSGDDPKVLGWTTDGAFFVWTCVERSRGPALEYFRPQADGGRTALPLAKVLKLSDDERGALETEPLDGDAVADETVVAVVHEVATGQQQRFPLSSRRLTPEGSVKQTDPRAFEAWKKAHPLKAITGLRGPRDFTAGEVELDWPEARRKEGDEVTIHYSVGVGADRFDVFTLDDGGAYGLFRPQYAASWWWDPTGRRVALSVERGAAQTMRGEVPAEAEFILAPLPPRVELLAPERLQGEVPRVSALIEAAGAPIGAVGVATKDREATVIYAGAKHRELAKRIAKALPGATVEPLTWKANGELVVALGAPR